jgi:hypothetical protein
MLLKIDAFTHGRNVSHYVYGYIVWVVSKNIPGARNGVFVGIP